MKIRTFMPEDYPAVVAIHDSLGIVWPERPRTSAAWAEADRQRSPKVKYQRWVAVVEVAWLGSHPIARALGNTPRRAFMSMSRFFPSTSGAALARRCTTR